MTNPRAARRAAIEMGTPRRTPSFEEFYRREYPPMVAIARALLRDVPSAEDLVQESFVAAHRNWGKVSTYDDPRAWVRRVMLNRISSLRRHLGAEMRAMTRFGNEPDRDTTPEMSPEASAVWDEVRRLPRRQAQVIVLHYVAQMTTSEIGRTLGCSPGAVKAHLHRGRKRLEQGLSDWKEE
jgi:RNA polymerase sigma-70 factor (ECF subfamily)